MFFTSFSTFSTDLICFFVFYVFFYVLTGFGAWIILYESLDYKDSMFHAAWNIGFL